MDNRRGLSAKQIISVLLAAFAVASAGAISFGAEVRSVVFSARSDQALNGFQENGPVVRAMVDELVKNVTGKGDVASAWKSLVSPGDRVGLKVAAVGGKYFSTHREVVEAVLSGLAQAGIARKDVIVWDRGDLVAAGFSNHSGFKLRNVEPVTGYNAKAVVNSPIMGRLIWGDLNFTNNKLAGLLPSTEQVSSESHWSNVASKEVTKIVNLPVIVADENCGIAGALYNVTIPNLDNWRRFLQRPNFGNPYICELYTDPNIGPKVVLTLMDGLIAQYAGGPEFKPDYAFAHKTLYASKDPVALDSVAFRKILQWRKEAKLPNSEGHGAYLESAQEMELGNFAEDRIEVRELEGGNPRAAALEAKSAQ